MVRPVFNALKSCRHRLLCQLLVNDTNLLYSNGTVGTAIDFMTFTTYCETAFYDDTIPVPVDIDKFKGDKTATKWPVVQYMSSSKQKRVMLAHAVEFEEDVGGWIPHLRGATVTVSAVGRFKPV